MSHNVEIVEALESIKIHITAISKEKIKWWEKLDKIIIHVVPKVEMIADGWEGEDKKQLALQIIEELWFKHFDNKRIPNFIEKPGVRFLGGKMIDAFVSLMNKRGIFKHRNG